MKIPDRSTVSNLALVVVSLFLMATGCAKWRNEVAADGGVWGSYEGDYIVRNDSGGRIMDVWVLTSVIVQPENSGAGWLFRDSRGDVIHLGGDVKVIRLKDGSLMSQYHEYHAEFETNTYQELYGDLGVPDGYRGKFQVRTRK